MITSLLAVVLSLFEPADTTITLQGVTVSGQRQRDFQMRSSQSAVQISHDYLQQHFSGSLMQTLEGVPGVKAMAIGSGQSKPTIRGLGFNRLAVTEDGIKHEGQQWGDDHGLEIDQFAVDRAEVIIALWQRCHWRCAHSVFQPHPHGAVGRRCTVVWSLKQ